MLAIILEPDPSGVGTHRQLGMEGCTILVRTGWPCPMCGMTTAFSHFAHGHLVEGFLTQPFGAVLFVATLTLFTVGLLDLVRPMPQPRWSRVLQGILDREVLFSLVILGGLLLGWLYKSWAMGKFLTVFS